MILLRQCRTPIPVPIQTFLPDFEWIGTGKKHGLVPDSDSFFVDELLVKKPGFRRFRIGIGIGLGIGLGIADMNFWYITWIGIGIGIGIGIEQFRECK